MTYDKFISSFQNEILPNKEHHIRHGQCLINYLGDVWMEEYTRIVGEDKIDCFYRDDLIPNCLEHLSKVWVNYPN